MALRARLGANDIRLVSGLVYACVVIEIIEMGTEKGTDLFTCVVIEIIEMCPEYCKGTDLFVIEIIEMCPSI